MFDFQATFHLQWEDSYCLMYSARPREERGKESLGYLGSRCSIAPASCWYNFKGLHSLEDLFEAHTLAVNDATET